VTHGKFIIELFIESTRMVIDNIFVVAQTIASESASATIILGKWNKPHVDEYLMSFF
jgi:hypothetical protein